MRRPTLCTHGDSFDPESFTREDLAHRFALWAASRGAQVRGLPFGPRQFVPALDGLQPDIVRTMILAKSEKAFDAAHTGICRALIQEIRDRDVAIAFGRAAKLLNLYLKVVLVLSDPERQSASWCHPPIDSRMLTALGRQGVQVPPGCVPWSGMEEAAYVNLIRALRKDARLGGHPIWKWESLWCPLD